MPRGEAVVTFQVSMPTIERYVRLRRESGEVAPRKQVRFGPAPVKVQALHAWLPTRLEQAADATLVEHAAAFNAEPVEVRGGVTVSPATVYRAISTLPGKWSLKQRPR